MERSASNWADEASARVSGLADDVNERFKDASAGLRDLDEQTRAFVKHSPFVALAAAVAGGFLLGRLLSRL
ncbi:MAG: hypothetical protein E6J72_00485 [Deltaproteobacteria bacterium]|nr:MAG: hypothetical protein E6J72_00485 [Deltaproteobacteria bacterium]